MPDFPNLDYEPGPAESSYSRVGPRGSAETERSPRPEPAPAIQVVRHEMAAELGVTPTAEPGARPAARRRRNHRKYSYTH